MKMTYDDFKPGKYYKYGGLYVFRCEQNNGEKNLVDLDGTLFCSVQSALDHWYNSWLGECDRDGNLLEAKHDCPECERLKERVKELEAKLKDKLAVKDEPEMVEFDGIPGKWFPYTDGDTVLFQERTLFQTITESERVCPSAWDDCEHFFYDVYRWDDIIAYRPADREDC